MADTWTGEGYDAQVGGDGGLFLRLKTKDQEVRLRIITGAYRYMDTIDAGHSQSGKDEEVKRVAWGAIYKEMIDGKLSKRPVIFVSGPQVYGALQELNEDDDWGDPTTFDVKITRTEVAGKYYSTMPVPNKKPEQSVVSEDDMRAAEELGVATVGGVRAHIEKQNKPSSNPSAPTNGAPAAHMTYSTAPPPDIEDDPFLDKN